MAAAGTAAPKLADCNAAPARTLKAEAALPAGWGEARAAWLDERHLRWAGAPPPGPQVRYRLLASSTGALQVAEGMPARGVERQLPLAAARAPARADAGRHSHIGDGAVLAASPRDVQRLRALHRGQLLLVREDGAGRVQAATRVQAAGALDELFAPAAEKVDRFGATPTATGVSWALWAPTARQVALCLYAGPQGPAQALRTLRRAAASGSWQLRLRGERAGRVYAYLVDVFVPGTGIVRNLVTDPYSLGLTADSRRSAVIDLAAPATQPPQWDSTPRPDRVQANTDLVIYELHVRDHSAIDASVPPARRGKYLAFTEEASLGMRHLKRLSEAGVTDIHFLPIFDLATVPERGCIEPKIPAAPPDSEVQQAAVAATKLQDCFNWGYDPFHFNAPEGSFASDADDPVVRIRELRAMVQALHRLNLRVGMDMVYNHTTASGQNEKSVLDRVVPGYYHRLNAKGEVEKSTCCDNTATEARMMARLMIDSAVIWARDYRIDSMRFDLMGHQPRAAMERLQQAVDRAAGRRIHLIGEGWNFGEVANGQRFVQASQLSLNGSAIATFNDRLRDAVRGGTWGSPEEVQRAQGLSNGLHVDPNARAAGRDLRADWQRAGDLARAGLAGSVRSVTIETFGGERKRLEQVDYGGQPAGYAAEPGEVVNYTENHDNQTLFDSNAVKLPQSTSGEDRARVQHLGNAFVALAQGVAYFHAGQEILRSKSLDRNSYDSGDWFNRIDWSLQDNHFGTGLPLRSEAGEHWPVYRPLLADASIKPTPAQIRWTLDAFTDLLQVRAGTTLLRLRSAADIRDRLSFPATTPAATPALHVTRIDGRGYPGAGHAELVHVINVDKVAQTFVVEALRGVPLQLHPVHRAPQAADRRAAESRFDAASGRFEIPPRTAVVFVLP